MTNMVLDWFCEIPLLIWELETSGLHINNALDIKWFIYEECEIRTDL